jgi:hypothetical protein
MHKVWIMLNAFCDRNVNRLPTVLFVSGVRFVIVL